MVLSVTPCQVAPPLDPPAHCPTHGGCSSKPETQNALPVVEPLAAEETPTRRGVAPLPAGGEPGATDEPGAAPPPGAPAGGPPPPGSAAAPDGCGSGAEEDAAPGVPDPNCPPSVLPGAALLDGATITRMIWAATSSANGA